MPLDQVPTLEPGGPRRKVFHAPGATRAGIVTCGGLCPGLNDVIRGLVMELKTHYGVSDVVGFRNGFAGLVTATGARADRADRRTGQQDQHAGRDDPRNIPRARRIPR